MKVTMINRRLRYVLFLMIGLILFVKLSYYDDFGLKSERSNADDNEMEPVSKKTKDGKETQIKISSFRFCSSLQHSTFILNSSLDTVQFAQEVDKEAKAKYEEVMNRYPHFRPFSEDALRFSCYSAAHGANNIVRTTEKSKLLHIDPESFFPILSINADANRYRVISTLSSIAGKSCTLKKHYKFVFAVFVHNDFEAIKTQYKRIRHQDTLIIYHVDLRSPDLYIDLREFLFADNEAKDDCNVLILDRRFAVHWGHSSIVFSHLEAFFQAYDIATWDYIINFSAYDYLLKSHDAIYNKLTPGENYIKYEPVTEGYRQDRINAVSFSTTNHRRPMGFWYTDRPFELEGMQVFQHDQWMILSRDFIKKLRSSKSAFDLLAWCEHLYIPDEMFFASWAASMKVELEINLVNDMKRFLRFTPGYANPDWLGMNDVQFFKENHFIARKINPAWSGDLIELIDKSRAEEMLESTNDIASKGSDEENLTEGEFEELLQAQARQEMEE